ncbi:MAG: hypothetical protein B7X99_20865 [Rhizobiales bacterium 17-65-6]|jgi:uncharacterized membrane protein|uniref:SRPBCC family protein n=1 Tax=Xanthobacteraceae TaxID=335928 RepID=UPI000BCB9726|nr:MAG: hypothetical protein B7X99_20865 [Rhizobiales bacterium 17-65-6]
MAITRFNLATLWRLEQPLDRVWDLIVDVEGWPDWWPAVKSITVLERGFADGIGAAHCLTWRTALLGH